ncbi:lysozyme inhibitor LprI family protein [Clostridium perfringens]|nr:lysozyme inhibitor LprI family protein [Clostridium perfringens]
MLNEAYAELEKQLSKEEIDKLRDEELNWIKSNH